MICKVGAVKTKVKILGLLEGASDKGSGMGLGGGGEGGTLVGREGECRVAVLGEPGVGKNALVTRFVRGEFPMVRQNCKILSIR